MVWCDVMWCGVVWCGVMRCDNRYVMWRIHIYLTLSICHLYLFIFPLTLLTLFSFTGQTRHNTDRRWVTPRNPHRHRHFLLSTFHYLCHCLSPCCNFNLLFWCVSTSEGCRQLLSEQQVEASRSNAGADLESRFHLILLVIVICFCWRERCSSFTPVCV